MFYRVDYLLAVMLAGFLIGMACSRSTSQFSPSRIARAFYVITLALIGLRIVCFLGSVAQPKVALWSIAGALASDIGLLLFGALFGLALRRQDRRGLLLHPAIFSALCIGTAASFALSGIGKAFSLDWMINFFHQSGYSAAFLKCVMSVEVFAALAMLIPSTVIAAVAVLAIDMFGAVYTHVHNGDPLNDSTGAIGALIRLAVIAVLWARQRPSPEKPPRRLPLAAIAAGGAFCLIIAVAGGALMRHIAHP